MEHISNILHREFRHLCWLGDMPKIHEAIATGRLTTDDLDTGLRYATSMSHADVVGTLFDAGARVSADAIGALHGKDFHQDPQIIRLFLDNGLDPNTRDSRGEPILPMISNSSATAVLLSAGADPNLCGPRGIPPLSRIMISLKRPDIAIFELYLEHGAKFESSLLFHSIAPRVRQGELKTRFLLDRGADPNVTSHRWGTPLHLATRLGKVEVVKILMEAGADPTVLSVGMSLRVGKTSKTPTQVAEFVVDTERREAILGLLQGYSR